MKRYLKILMFFLFLFLAFSCNKNTTSERPLTFYVRVNSLKKISNNFLTFSGIVFPKNSVDLSFKINGEIKRLYIKVGDHVKRGQLIGVIDDRIPLLQKRQAELYYDKLKTEIEYLKRLRDKMKHLYDRKLISEDEFNKIDTKYNAALAGLEAVKQKVNMADEQLKYTKLYAPFGGVVYAVFFSEGENVTSGVPIVTIFRDGKKKVRFFVPRRYIDYVKKGMKVNIKGMFDSSTAIIKEISTGTGILIPSYPVIAEIQDSQFFKIGEEVSVNFYLNNNNNNTEWLIPSTSLISQGNKSFVFVFIPSSKDKSIGTVKKVQVTPIRITQHGVLIDSNLSPDDLVVTAGLRFLKDNMKVKVWRDK